MGDARARVLREVRDVIRGRTREAWLGQFADADVCLTTVYKPEELATDPHVARSRCQNDGRRDWRM